MPRAAIALALLALACNKPRTTTPPEPGPVTVDEARPVAESFATALEQCDRAAIARDFDSQLLIDRVVAKLALRRMERRSMAKGMREGLKLDEYLCTEGDRFKLLEVMAHGDRALARYRNSGDDGVNYLEVPFGRSPNGAVRAYDLFDYHSGEYLGERFQRLFAAMESDLRNSSYSRRIKQTMERVDRLESEGRHADARLALASLPPELRRLRSTMTRDLQLAAQIDDAQYLAAMDAVSKAFPDDPSLEFVLFDAHFIRKDWDRALASVDALERRVGADAYVAVMRSNVDTERKQFAAAAGHARTAIERDPDLQDGHWALVVAQLGNQAWADAAVTLEIIRDRFDLEISREDASADPIFRGFVESEAAAGYFADE